jgi:hypothetical protein
MPFIPPESRYKFVPPNARRTRQEKQVRTVSQHCKDPQSQSIRCKETTVTGTNVIDQECVMCSVFLTNISIYIQVNQVFRKTFEIPITTNS